MRLLLLLFIGLLFVNHTESWGKDGHELIANLAWNRLSDRTQTRISEILATRRHHSYYQDNDDNSPLAQIANWADHIRFLKQYQWATPLHFIDVQDEEGTMCPCHAPSSGQHSSSRCKFVYERDCLHDKCVAGAIVNFTQQLNNASSIYNLEDSSWNWSNKTRTKQALEFTTHFVGDIHQPLHCSRASDRGGNDYHVKFDYHPKANLRNTYHHSWNLHSVWDSGMIEKAVDELYKSSRPAFQQDLTHYIKEATDSGIIYKWLECANGQNVTCTTQWGQESLDLALVWAYRNTDGSEVISGSVLNQTYFQSRFPIVMQQLAVAGVRLASTLERVLGTEELYGKSPQ